MKNLTIIKVCYPEIQEAIVLKKKKSNRIEVMIISVKEGQIVVLQVKT